MTEPTATETTPRDPAECPTNGCTNRRAPRQYLCKGCWYTLHPTTRGRLNRRDQHATERLKELYRALHNNTPLREIRVSS